MARILGPIRHDLANLRVDVAELKADVAELGDQLRSVQESNVEIRRMAAVVSSLVLLSFLFD
jgi:hypothetical protein